jgi:hypothetical protein
MKKTTRNISKNHALPAGSQKESEIYGARPSLDVQEKEMRLMQPATLFLMTLVVAMTVACATPSKQPYSYEECISLCSDEVISCTRSCYSWKWSAQQSLACVRNCNEKSEECRQQCSTRKERTPEHHDHGGDGG